MTRTTIAFLAACAFCGCATKGTRLTSAPPMRAESKALFLVIETRKVPHDAPFSTGCNVNLKTLHNTSIPVWHFPKVVFYAEQDGEFFPLRRIETYSGEIFEPYSLTGRLVSLPRPPRPGRWRIFAIQEHSELVYARHLKSYGSKKALVYVGDQDTSKDGMWTKPLVSNSIFVEFAELEEGRMRSAQSFIQALIDAGQYDPDFREPRGDPTRQLQRKR